MKSHLKPGILTVLFFAFLLTGCGNLFQAAPTETPLPSATETQTSSPAPTHTPAPTRTATLLPTETKTPAPTFTKVPSVTPKPDCNKDEVLALLKSKIEYEEFSVLYNQLDEYSVLGVWYVDPEINAQASKSELEKNVEQAIYSSLVLAQQLFAADRCVEELFTDINPVVVDKNYNGWLSAMIDIMLLPRSVQIDKEAVDSLSKNYVYGFMELVAPEIVAAAPAGSCTWVEARERMQLHFSEERQNVTFYYVSDDMGRNVWAQWDCPADLLSFNFVPSVLNITMELECLYPEPDNIIFQTVDEDGNILIMALWEWEAAKNMDFEQIQIIYSQ